MLTQQLRNLEHNKIIIRKSYNTVPQTVEYSLSDMGLKLIPIMRAMDEWGKKCVEFYN